MAWPVTVLEANASLSDESRASTFHPPTLDMLEQLGVAKTADRPRADRTPVPVSCQARRRDRAVRFCRHCGRDQRIRSGCNASNPS